MEAEKGKRLVFAYEFGRHADIAVIQADNLKGSGVDVVLAHTMYSIVGALSLQRGGEAAARTVQEKILRPLGLR